MSNRCRSCGTQLSEYLLELEENLTRAHYWWNYGREQSGTVIAVEGVGDVMVVAANLGNDYPEDKGNFERVAFVVLKIGDKYYRKNASVDSYGGVEWNLAFNEVKPVKKEVTVYDYS